MFSIIASSMHFHFLDYDIEHRYARVWMPDIKSFTHTFHAFTTTQRNLQLLFIHQTLGNRIRSNSSNSSNSSDSNSSINNNEPRPNKTHNKTATGQTKQNGTMHLSEQNGNRTNTAHVETHHV